MWWCCKNTTQDVVVRQSAASRDVVAQGSSVLLHVVVRQYVAGWRPGKRPISTPIPPFFDKHALKIGEDSLRVTNTPKNVIVPLLKKFLKNEKYF